MAQQSFWQNLKRYFYMLLGTGLLAFSVKCVYDPSGMVVGGFTGVAILVKEISSRWIDGGIPLGVTTFLLNLPVFFLAYPIKGKAFVLRTFFATLLVSLWLLVLPDTFVEQQDFVLAALFGGVSSGAGIGIVLTTGTTTGGTDMLASLLQRKFPAYTIAQIMAVMDALIIIAGSFLFGLPMALYAVASVYVTAKVSDAIVVGIGYARSVFIVTNQPQDVAEQIFGSLKRGVTGISAQGMYTQKERMLLFCVVAKKQIVRLKECIYEVDPNAFVIVTEAREVHGEGFRQIEQK